MGAISEINYQKGREDGARELRELIKKLLPLAEAYYRHSFDYTCDHKV